MRLYSTLQREKVDLPPPPGPIRMYFCGPTVYARAHVGNARPFVVGMWLRNWLRARGYDLTVIEVSPVPFASPGRSELDRLAYRLWLLRREALRSDSTRRFTTSPFG